MDELLLCSEYFANTVIYKWLCRKRLENKKKSDKNCKPEAGPSLEKEPLDSVCQVSNSRSIRHVLQALTRSQAKQQKEKDNTDGTIFMY